MSNSRYPHCRIFLRQIHIFCKIGIDPAEKEVRQTLLLDVDILPILPKTAAEDSENPIVDYAAVLRRLVAFADSKQHLLMENFANEAAAIILDEYAVQQVTITCRKPKPFSELAEAGVEVTLTADG